ncbi:hypothetical protein [uncultured Methanobrevibacter sp.]|uniref:hypothetical protein n=1 Tax=uncultured Methanobrevibacter sp. TaxID=253161 RepID=UPI0026309D18|nr:hypothetical protein [uncultured Methanobrevibacter sp.]
MGEIKIHVLHTGRVCVAPELPFGGEHCNPINASGVFGKKMIDCGCQFLHI